MRQLAMELTLSQQKCNSFVHILAIVLIQFDTDIENIFEGNSLIFL